MAVLETSCPKYQRRRPELTPCYRIINQHLDSFVAERAREGRPLPEYVLEEFEAYLKCGVPAFGFLRLKCGDCQEEKIVAFSCKKPETPEGIKYDGNLLSPASSALTAVIEAARNRLPPHLNQIVGSASDLVKRDFNKDSPMARFVTDQMREATGADFAFINTGSLRANFEKGAVAYDALYKMLPFATRLVVLNDVPTRTIIDTLKISAAGSKPYGFLVQSGLKIKLGSSANQRFLQSVTTLAGEPLYQKQPDGEHYLSDRVFRVATTDFLMRRNSGPEVLRSFRPKVDLGVLREVIARKLLDSPAVIPTTVDDRWQ